MYVYALKGHDGRTFAAKVEDHNEAGSVITYLKLNGWRVFWRIIG